METQNSHATAENAVDTQSSHATAGNAVDTQCSHTTAGNAVDTQRFHTTAGNAEWECDAGNGLATSGNLNTQRTSCISPTFPFIEAQSHRKALMQNLFPSDFQKLKNSAGEWTNYRISIQWGKAQLENKHKLLIHITTWIRLEVIAVAIKSQTKHERTLYASNYI